MMTEQEFAEFEIPLEHTPCERSNRLHIGLVQLNTDHTLETDWAKLIGTQAAIFSSRVYYSSVLTGKALAEIGQGIAAASQLIAAGLPMDVMAFGCTSASMIIGSQKIEKLLTSGRSDIPGTNPWRAAKAAFKALNAKKIGVFSPYPTAINLPLYEGLLNAGYKVPVIGALRIEKDIDISKVSSTSIIQGIEKMLTASKVDSLFMSCTNLRVLEHIEAIEDRFGIPVVSSNQAMFWHAMVLAGKPPKCPGFGYLLSG